MSSIQSVILAAGKGTRMKSKKSKILHEVAGRPIIDWVVRCALDAGSSRVVTILGHQSDFIEAHLKSQFGDLVSFAYQREQLGTGHAVYCALSELVGYAERTVILSGDVPNLSPETLSAFLLASEDQAGLMTSVLEDAKHYGRIVRNEKGVQSIVEFKDASAEERKIKEINAGFYAFDTADLNTTLKQLLKEEPTNAQGEYYLTDLVAMIGPCLGWQLPDAREMEGVNNRLDLAEAESFARKRINTYWMLEGVTFIDPETTYIGAEVKLAPDVTLAPHVILKGKTTIAADTFIDAGAVIEDTSIGEGVHVLPHCHLEDSKIDNHAKIGPFVHLRPGADIGPECKVGNFVEIKKVRLDRGAKANHHSYLGDGHVGEKCNIGAGTIFCNYDGKNKNFITLGKGVFIGSNSALVAPLTIGDNAYVGAGSTITKDIPKDSLAVARGRQKNIENWSPPAKPKK